MPREDDANDDVYQVLSHLDRDKQPAATTGGESCARGRSRYIHIENAGPIHMYFFYPRETYTLLREITPFILSEVLCVPLSGVRNGARKSAAARSNRYTCAPILTELEKYELVVLDDALEIVIGDHQDTLVGLHLGEARHGEA